VVDAELLARRVKHVALVRRIVAHDATGSTNDDVRRLAAEGAPEGTVVVASQQLAGRGRLGRTWESPNHLGLYLSILLRPTETSQRIGRYPIACAVAVCAACRELAGDRAILKWPNDVLAGGAKLAGVLSELRQGAAGTELVVGVGINVNQLGDDFSVELRGRATSLRILRAGAPVDREGVAAGLLEALGETIVRLRKDAWAEVAERFLRYAPHAVGTRVRLAAGGSGLTRGIDPTGALRVETSGGIVLVHASDSVALIGD
jgi:BirA family biotin operon repressor/biotin-[acetyl-CoA-carboxylase] ligase